MEESKVVSSEHTPLRGTPLQVETEETSSNSPAGTGELGISSSFPEAGADEARKAADQTREESEEFAHMAEETIESTKERGRSMLEERKSALADGVSSIERALRRTASELQGEHQETAGHYAEQAADGLGQVSRALREQDFDTLVDKTEDFARRQPGVFLGGAVAAGFLLARFLKSSGRRVTPVAESSTPRSSGPSEYRSGTERSGYGTSSTDPQALHGKVMGTPPGTVSDEIFVPSAHGQERGV